MNPNDIDTIDTYLSASRSYIEDAKRRIANMGFCCPSILGDLENRQIELERMAWSERQKGNLGGPLLIPVIIGTVVSGIGAWVYSHFTTAKTTSEYMKCLERYQADPHNKTVDEAKSICTGGNDKQDITTTIKIAIYGGVAIMALYVVSQFLGKKK